MEHLLKYIKRTRELFISILDELSIEQLNKIPQGFNNNIAWNFGHIIVSTEGLCYLRSGVKPDLKIPFGAKYTKGTKPETFISKDEIDILKTQCWRSFEKIESDLKANKFNEIPHPYSTHTYGYEMKTIEEILTCCVAHESMHYGVALATKKIV